jgi:type IV pilus assembly protein PilC
MDFFRICLMFFQRGLYMITKLNNRELFQFCEQFSIILRSGMSAIEGLAILNDDSQTERGKEILTFLYKDMEESGSLAHAMEQSGAFPASAAAYVRTGEETGCLDEVMKGLSAFYAKEIQITDQIQSAVAYPLIMLGMMTAVIVILLVKVLPVFRQVFRQLGLEMSGISGALLGIGETLSHYSTAFLVLLAAMIGFILFLVLHPKGQELIRKIVCRFPGMKEIPVNLDYSRLCQCISLGIRSGLSPELCVELAGAVVTQTEIREKLTSIQKQLAEGYGFTEAITESGLFKAMELRLISLGFQAGASDEVMEKLAEQYEEKSTDSVSHIVSILEPTIVIVLSILVGLVLLSVMMPLLGLLSEMIA